MIVIKSVFSCHSTILPQLIAFVFYLASWRAKKPLPMITIQHLLKHAKGHQHHSNRFICIMEAIFKGHFGYSNGDKIVFYFKCPLRILL